MEEMGISRPAEGIRETGGGWGVVAKIVSSLATVVAAFLHSMLAFAQHDYGYGFGLLGGFCAWPFVAASCYLISLESLPTYIFIQQ